MLCVVRQRVAQSLAAFAQVARNPAMRNLQLAGVGSTLGIWAYAVAIAVYAYRHDGATAVGLLYFVRWSLAGVFSPWLAVLADRLPRRRVMLASDLGRVVLVGGMAAVAELGGPSLVIYTLAVLGSIVGAAFLPAQSALLPSLASTPEELTAANVAMNTTSSVGVFAGPALAGALLAFGSAGLVFALTSLTFVWSAACVVRIPAGVRPQREGEPERVSEVLLGGFRAVRDDYRLRLLVGLTAAQTLVLGALQVLVVVVALQVLGAGNGGVGWLNATLGVGGIAGALVVAVLGARLARNLGVGLLLLGAPLMLVALWPRTLTTIVLFAAIGVGSTVADVAGQTLLQRIASDESLARVFGVLQSIILIMLATGAAVTPLLVSAVSARVALVVVGGILPVLFALLWPRIRAMDEAAAEPVERLALLRGVSIFAPLPEPVLERLAAAAREVRVPAGANAVTQGEPGDRFYVIADGAAVTEVDGAEVNRLWPGEFFGEIALLREVPRTATVRALEELRLLAVERDVFLGAVTGHAPSRDAADQVVAARLPAPATV